MRTPALVLLSFSLLLCAGTARADRYQRGLALYQSRCTNCHSLGWEHPAKPEHGRVDLTRVVDRRDDAALRRWLENPVQEKRDTACRHQVLEKEHVDNLIHMFHVRATPPPRKAPHRGAGGGGGRPIERAKPSKDRRKH